MEELGPGSPGTPAPSEGSWWLPLGLSKGCHSQDCSSGFLPEMQRRSLALTAVSWAGVPQADIPWFYLFSRATARWKPLSTAYPLHSLTGGLTGIMATDIQAERHAGVLYWSFCLETSWWAAKPPPSSPSPLLAASKMRT